MLSSCYDEADGRALPPAPGHVQAITLQANGHDPWYRIAAV